MPAFPPPSPPRRRKRLTLFGVVLLALFALLLLGLALLVLGLLKGRPPFFVNPLMPFEAIQLSYPPCPFHL